MATLNCFENLCLIVLLKEMQSGKLALIVNLSEILKHRMRELDIDVAELVKRYCKLRTDRGEQNIIPNNQRRSVVRILNNEGSPSAETLVDLINSLDGELNIKWRTEKEVIRFEVEEREETLSNSESNAGR